MDVTQSADSSASDAVINSDIIELLGLTHLPEDQKEKLRTEIGETIENRVFNRLEEEMEKKGLVDAYSKALEAGGTSFDEFLDENKVNLQQMFLEEALIYKVQMKSAADLFSAGVKMQVTSDKQPTE